ncbi:MAG: CRTAC1 family protein [Candidatus Cloacimonetes bacterium]|nr:CRTAC1 family protein [Candidatus Cloacimonadota bacterium]MCF7814680.1 CRTAC1 family protein [Candidatus Cloacimonadota bacterium]MCF7868242.1 CRTAC1 family protein [Candidatus Cloacimonadota bacterium]MCF7883675.1 CRTAC1 family protein [Candidatus Cloacimonadota bacterium]
MKKFGYFMIFLLILSCAQNTLKEKHHKSYQELIDIWESAESDTLTLESAENHLIKYYPESEKVFELANEEFYDRLYPIWRDDSLKVKVITELLEKYPKTNWRRTMFQYLFYSLNELGRTGTLYSVLADFRVAFPNDYLPFASTARYYSKNDHELQTAEIFAEKAFRISFNYPKLDHYPPMQWEMEQRSASVNAAVIWAETLIKNGKYQVAINKLMKIIEDNKLGIDDETTLGGCYYYLAEAYKKLDKQEAAVDAAINSLKAGDSRNYYTPKADSLLQEMIGYMDLSEPEYLDFCRKRSGYNDVEFSDITEKTGLEGIKAGRVAWADFDDDGFADLLLNGCRLFHNENGKKFKEITSEVFNDTIKANGGLWGDFDNDADLDIITKDQEGVWLQNEGVFEKVSGPNSIQNNKFSTEGLGIGDINNDGWLDAYFANYENRNESGSEYEEDQLFKGIGDGLFYDVTERADILPIDGENRAGRGVNMGDFDNDGDLDIFVSNYRLQENFLWQNDGTGHFENAALEKDVAGIEIEDWWGHTIGSEWGDLDNDSDLDLFCANLAHPRYIDFSNMSMVYLNSGAPDYTFSDNRRTAGIRFEETHSEPCLADFNNDGFLDVYINCIYEKRRSFLYMSNRDGTYREVTFLAGVRHFNGWGVAAADFDNDGDLDLLAAGGTIQLFRNDTKKNNWLKVKVIGKDHVDAIGTRLELSNKNINLIREIQGGKGTTNQHDLVQHFGLGYQKAPFKFHIRFPNGEKRIILIKEVNRLIKVVQ